MKLSIILLAAIALFAYPVVGQDKSADDLFREGVLLEINGKQGEAIQAYSSALAIDPSHLQSRESKAILLLATGKVNEAYKEVDVVGTFDKQASLLLKATLKATERQFDEAIEIVRKAIDLAPRDASVYSCAAHIYMLKRDYPAAITAVGHEIDLTPHEQRRIGYQKRARAFMFAGRHLEAIDDLNRAIRLEKMQMQKMSDLTGVHYAPQDAGLFHERGECHFRLNHFDLAISDFSYAIAKAPNTAKSYYYRSLAYKGKGDSKLSSDDITRARSIDPQIEEHIQQQQ